MHKVYQINSNGVFYCGTDEFKNTDWELDSWSFLFCAKNPFHKEIVGYDGNLPKNHPEYLVAYRPKQHLMSLNMIDAPKPDYFSDKMILSGIDFIEHELCQNRNVLVVCNQGQSRSPTMCLMYMMAHGDFDVKMTHSQVFDIFHKIAPEWNPNTGILLYCIEFWNKVKRGEINEKVY